jgi:membrane-associated phospholipid phosphatase
MDLGLVKRFTVLGDPMLLLLAALGMFFYLWIDDARRNMARSWAQSIGLCIGLVLVSKLFLHVSGRPELGPFRLFSPSGHVAIATTFYGNIAILLARGRGRSVRNALLTGAVLLIALLAASRMVLQLHSLLEIAFALAIGLGALGPFYFTLAGHPGTITAGQPIALLVLLAVARFSHIDGEALVARLAGNAATTTNRSTVPAENRQEQKTATRLHFRMVPPVGLEPTLP